ncbi:MAG: peptide chain release factor N(5)-glutamine methyltransferase [Clostridia bacterium]
MNIKQILDYGIIILKESNIEEPILKARMLLANILNQPKEYLLIHETEELNLNDTNKYKEGIKKLVNNMPIQYIINKQEFMGLEFYVDENVLIPQPDTEILVEEVIKICKEIHFHNKNKKIKILDLCTGSGAIGISLKKYIQNSEITLSDISNKALEIAKKNCINIIGNTEINIIESDLFEKIDVNNKFDIIVSNPPYIETKTIQTLDKEVQKEPKLALDGGEDGLNLYRRIIKKAHNYLSDNGILVLEIGYNQKDKVINLIRTSNMYREVYSKKDLSNNDRIVACKKRSN